METLSFEITINAPKNKIWDILWSPETYPQWTHFFMPNCRIETDWEVNGRTLFTDGTGNGMVSTISHLDEPNEVTFNHIGVIENGVEDTESKEVKEWSGAPERYFLIELDNGQIKLQVEVQTLEIWKDHMTEGFNKGLPVIKELAEKK